MKRIPFDVQQAIKDAWDFLWANNLKNRAEMKPDAYRYAETYYLTATDIANQVRQFAVEALEGKPRGSTGRAYGTPFRSLRMSGVNIFNAVRDWLRHEGYAGRIVSHNFGKGHISGARYRPAGEPISEIEQATIAAKKKRKERGTIVHFSEDGIRGPNLCAPPKKRTYWSRPRHTFRTKERERVTCKRCLALLAKQEAA